MRAPERGGDWGHWHVPSQGPCWSAPQLCKWRSPSCDPSCGWGYVTLAACISTYAALLNPSSQACPDLPRRRSRSTRCGALRHSRRCSMHSLKRSEEHTSELQSRLHLVCRLLLEKKKKKT